MDGKSKRCGCIWRWVGEGPCFSSTCASVVVRVSTRGRWRACQEACSQLMMTHRLLTRKRRLLLLAGRSPSHTHWPTVAGASNHSPSPNLHHKQKIKHSSFPFIRLLSHARTPARAHACTQWFVFNICFLFHLVIFGGHGEKKSHRIIRLVSFGPS